MTLAPAAHKARNIYLIVRNQGRFAMLYCASEGLEGRIAQSQGQYFPGDSEVFVLGRAAEVVPTGNIGMLETTTLSHLSLLHTLRDDWPEEMAGMPSGAKVPAKKTRKPRDGKVSP